MRKRFDEKVYGRRIKPLVTSWFASRTRVELEELAGDLIPLTAVKTIGDVVEDPGTAEREMVVEADYGDFGTLRMFGQPVKLSATPADPTRVANRMGEHSDIVLEGLADYSPEKIAALRERGVV